MGAPKKLKKKYSKPAHPWQKERILAEKELSKKYGLRRKYEIWKMNSILKNFSRQIKKLIPQKTVHAELERSQLLKKLTSLGLLDKSAKIADALSITLKDIMERRLQSLVYKKKLARSVRQARQFIIHRHIMVGDNRMTAPSYLVPVEEEALIQFAPASSLSDPNHAERFVEEKKAREKKETKKTEESGEDKKAPEEKTEEKEDKKPEAKKKHTGKESKKTGEDKQE